MTHKAVSSISEDSGKWLGEIPTDQIGVWLDYALLLVSFSVSGGQYFVFSLKHWDHVNWRDQLRLGKRRTGQEHFCSVKTWEGVFRSCSVIDNHIWLIFRFLPFAMCRYGAAFHGKFTFSAPCRANHHLRLEQSLTPLPLDVCLWPSLQCLSGPLVPRQVEALWKSLPFPPSIFP